MWALLREQRGIYVYEIKILENTHTLIRAKVIRTSVRSDSVHLQEEKNIAGDRTDTIYIYEYARCRFVYKL